MSDSRDLSYDDGVAVARDCIAEVVRSLGSDVQSAYLLGSLAHGGFAPAASDIDVCFVVRDVATGPAFTALMQQARESPHPLRRRLSLFWVSEQALRNGRPDGRLPAVDHADLITHGSLAYGRDVRAGLRAPTHEELVDDTARFVVDKWGSDGSWPGSLHRPEELLGQGVRDATKTVLFPVRFLWTVFTGAFGPVDEAVAWSSAWPDTVEGGARLAQRALEWRHSGHLDDGDEADVAAIREGLVPLWLQLLAALPPDPRLTALAAAVQHPG